MRLFLCDDNPEYRKLARVVLGGAHEIVGETADARDALRDLPALQPDVVLLDLNMPGMDGHTALPLLRDVMGDAGKIIVLTSGRAEDERQRSLDGGADGFIIKPVSAFALLDELDAAVRGDRV